MMKSFIIGLLLLSQNLLLAQEKIIVGKITDSNGEALFGVSICQEKTDNCSYTDFKGLFHLSIDPKKSEKIVIESPGYKSLTISGLDSISHLLNVRMVEEPAFSKKQIYQKNPKVFPNQIYRFGLIAFLQVDFLFNDFEDFRPLLEDYNVDLMNKISGIFSMELAGTYKGYYAGFNIGWAENSGTVNDSLEIEFNTTQYGLHFGYNLIDSRRFLFTPKVAVKWNRYRLLNYDKEDKIPIEKYLSERDLDIRINQLTGFIGFNLSYKIYNFNLIPSDYFTLGIYGGYAFKLHQKPWIYSSSNRLASNAKIGMKNYNVGFQFSFNLESL